MDPCKALFVAKVGVRAVICCPVVYGVEPGNKPSDDGNAAGAINIFDAIERPGAIERPCAI